MTDGEWLELCVINIREETASIQALWLARPDGEPLPGWDAGAHIKIRLPQGGDRQYSLINASPAPEQTTSPASYMLGVQREEQTRGGSLYVHSLQIGEIVRASAPVNQFRVKPGHGPVTLCAGGIGITPILSMASALLAEGRQPRLVYAGRSRNHLAFLPEVESLGLADLRIHCDDTDKILDLRGLMSSLMNDEELYLCGPTTMISAAVEVASTLGWSKDRLKFESFTSVSPVQGDREFEVFLKNSDKRFVIPQDKTILDVLLEAGEDPLHDCKRGDCSLCQVGVIEGVPDHRDNVLSAADRADGKVMHICVSRSKTPLLVLDL
jgi:vanillate O-demethylase ferredoxin subunit